MEPVACESVLRDRSLVVGDPLLMAHFDLPATRATPSEARQLVAKTLDSPTAPAGAAAVSYTAQLLVSELVTNAVLHARTGLHLGICADAQTMLFTVTDSNADPLPSTRGAGAPGLRRESGRGLPIVTALASDVGWRRRDDATGKIVWFTLRLPVDDGQ